MTRDELRATIQDELDYVMPTDKIMAFRCTSAILTLVDQYSVGVVLDAYKWGWDASDLDVPPINSERVEAWLKERK